MLDFSSDEFASVIVRFKTQDSLYELGEDPVMMEMGEKFIADLLKQWLLNFDLNAKIVLQNSRIHCVVIHTNERAAAALHCTDQRPWIVLEAFDDDED